MKNKTIDFGWIKILRSIRDHWIWENEKYLKWWLDILLEVNHDENKVLIGFDLIECKRGQSVRSLLSWSERWKVGKDTARNFLKLLQKDNMIIHENLTKTTRITVCNYDTYQSCLHDKQLQNKRKANAKQLQDDPNKNDKEIDTNVSIWQNDFEIYLSECREGYKKVMEDPEFLKEQQRLNPGINIPLTIEKGFKNFWSLKEGWNHKLKYSKNVVDINWKSTIVNSITNPKNKVYIQK